MPIDRSEWIWFSGEWVRWEDAMVHVTAHALHYGTSAFEGIRAYEGEGGPAIFRLDRHIRRLLDSCKMLRFDMTGRFRRDIGRNGVFPIGNQQFGGGRHG